MFCTFPFIFNTHSFSGYSQLNSGDLPSATELKLSPSEGSATGLEPPSKEEVSEEVDVAVSQKHCTTGDDAAVLDFDDVFDSAPAWIDVPEEYLNIRSEHRLVKH